MQSINSAEEYVHGMSKDMLFFKKKKLSVTI